jgi:hypothetical protein
MNLRDSIIQSEKAPVLPNHLAIKLWRRSVPAISSEERDFGPVLELNSTGATCFVFEHFDLPGGECGVVNVQEFIVQAGRSGRRNWSNHRHPHRPRSLTLQ